MYNNVLMSRIPDNNHDDTPEKVPETLSEALGVIDSLRTIIAKQREAARYDVSLPTMLNKASFETSVSELITLGNTFGLFIIDLDKFKLINDRLGHAAGDALLLDFSQLLNETFSRATDQLGYLEAAEISQARIGGDEFAVIVDISSNRRREGSPHIQMDKIYYLLEEVKARFIDEHPSLGELASTGFSIGAAMYDPRMPVDALTLFQQADEAMYEEKRPGTQ
jgi:diguanylate cyclase (GGDEF)-like protein